jgi:plasmid maintenance system antidote protein VapI
MHSGEIVKSALKAQDMSQVALAQAIGRDQSLISRYVKGTIEVSADSAMDIARVLNINFDVLHEQLQKDKFDRAMEKIKLKYNKR